jgi:hypothetical protein
VTTSFLGNITTPNLAITGLGTSGSPCLTVNAAGKVATTTCGGGSSQWTTTSTGIFYNGGNVSVSSTITVGNIGGAMWYFASGVNGAACNDTTDDTGAFNSLLSTVYNAGGGTIYVKGTCLISGAVVFPNDGAGSPTQVSIRITGAGSSANGYWGTLPASPSALDLRYNASVAKLDTRGAGVLEIDHITLEDHGSDCAPFIQTTNTTLNINNVAFSGTRLHSLACNDAIVLGGTTTTINGASAAPFQGYGTVIQDNFFDNIQRMVYGRVYANNIVVENNTYSNTSGNALTGGAAIEFDPANLGSAVAGNIISDNLLELSNVTYGIKFTDIGFNNYITGNGCWDTGSSYISCVDFGGTSGFNTVIPGESSGKLYMTDSSGQDTLLDTSGNNPSYFPSSQPSYFGGPIIDTSGISTFVTQGPNYNSSWWGPTGRGTVLDFEAGGYIVAAPTGAVRSGGTVTITTALAHDLLVGQSVTIAGVSDPSFDGTFTIVTVDSPNNNTFTYTQSGANSTSGGGTAQGPAESLLSISRNLNTVGYNTLTLQGATTNYITGPSGSSNLYIKTGGGGTLWLGDTTASNIYITNGKMYFNAGGTVAGTGRLNFASSDSIAFRNNAGTNDVNGISKNASDTVLVGGAAGIQLGGSTVRSGSASNTDLDGKLTLSSGTASYTFTGTYTSAPICTANDTTALNPVQVSATATTLTLTGTGTDVINYICMGRN